MTAYVFSSVCKQMSFGCEFSYFLYPPMKLLEVEDALYQKIARQSDSDGQFLSVMVHLLRTMAVNLCFFLILTVTLFIFRFCIISICASVLLHKCVLLSLNITAVTLISSLRHGQWQRDSESPSQTTSAPQRIVLLGQGLQKQSKKSLTADIKSQKTSAQTNEPPSLIQSSVASFVDSNSWLDNTSTSQLDNTQTPENNKSFIDDYTGTTPLIGEHE